MPRRNSKAHRVVSRIPGTARISPEYQESTTPLSAEDDDYLESKSTTRKNIMDVEERRRILESDPWALQVKAKCVQCGGCTRWIRLDQRNLYYGGLWYKHRNICREIRRLKGEVIPK
ncbi:hypothetical protein H0H93_015066, partial [Arthromyces matolae]